MCVILCEASNFGNAACVSCASTRKTFILGVTLLSASGTDVATNQSDRRAVIRVCNVCIEFCIAPSFCGLLDSGCRLRRVLWQTDQTGTATALLYTQVLAGRCCLHTSRDMEK